MKQKPIHTSPHEMDVIYKGREGRMRRGFKTVDPVSSTSRSLDALENLFLIDCQEGKADEALDKYRKLSMGGALSEPLICQMISCFGRTRRLDEARSIFNKNTAKPSRSHPSIYKAMLEAYSLCGEHRAARKVFILAYRDKHADADLYTSLVRDMADEGDHQAILRLHALALSNSISSEGLRSACLEGLLLLGKAELLEELVNPKSLEAYGQRELKYMLL